VKQPTHEAYGLLGAWREPEPLVAAARALRAHGLSHLDALTPFPVPEVDDALGMRKDDRLLWIVLAGGILGAVAAYALILYSVEIDYRVNVGGRPLNAWPAYLVLAFEGGVLGASLAAFVGMLALNGLPTFYHSVFNARSFTFARDDRFYLLVRADDPQFRAATVRSLLDTHGAVTVEEVPP
jgi:hypothetical protein